MDSKTTAKPRAKTGPKVNMSKAFLDQVETLAMLGATNAELALFFGKDVTSIDLWQKKYPEFRKARKSGGMIADMKVARSLYQRAVGYNYVEEQLVIVQGRPMKIKVKKHVIPDTRAQMLWLTNRQRQHWTNASQITVGGTVNHNHHDIKDIPIEELSSQSQKLLFEVAQKQLTSGTRNN